MTKQVNQKGASIIHSRCRSWNKTNERREKTGIHIYIRNTDFTATRGSDGDIKFAQQVGRLQIIINIASQYVVLSSTLHQTSRVLSCTVYYHAKIPGGSPVITVSGGTTIMGGCPAPGIRVGTTAGGRGSNGGADGSRGRATWLLPSTRSGDTGGLASSSSEPEVFWSVAIVLAASSPARGLNSPGPELI